MRQQLLCGAGGLLLASLVSGVTPAFAGPSYTPEELRRMVESGNYPDQGPVERNEATEMDYGACILTMDQLLSAIRPHYPVETIASTAILKTMKAWTNDGAVTMTCSALDKRLVVTSSPYR